MMRDQDNVTSLVERTLAQKVELGDNNSYAVKGTGKTSIELESSDNVHLSNTLYVPSFKNNLVSISFLEDKSDRITFFDANLFFVPKDLV